MDCRRIQQLPLALVNRIAAGEVIERPASVVKELVENSLDAGASDIVVEIEDGGRALVRIIDNGGGIAADDLALAFAAHATSKIATDDDLFNITTMGFRGEALASIGAVSQARIVSRTADSPVGYELYNRGGVVETVQAAAANVGTTVEARNLFFNTPARRKFLKGTATEFGHISETLVKLALAFPMVAFKLLHDGKLALDLPAVAEPMQRWLAAWPEEFATRKLNLDEGDAEIHLGGIIGLPDLARPTPKYQYIYLNGRSIRDKFIQHALREAYRGLTEPGRYPAAVLMLNMPPGDVDVNVHPTKSEVRFRDSNRIHGLILTGVRRVLLANDLAPRAVAAALDGFKSPEAGQSDVRQKLASFFKSSLADEPAAAPTPTWDLQPPPAPPTPLPAITGTQLVSTPAGAAVDQTGTQLVSPVSPPPEPTAGETSCVPVPVCGETSYVPVSGRAPAIQLHNSYLVAQSDDGMIIIDQHALHERIMYEELLARLSRGPLESQHLLIPQTIRVSSRQLELLEQIQPLLKKLGIEADAIGPTSAAVHAFPTFLHRLTPGDFLRELLERGEQELLDLNHEEVLHEILDMMACKAAVKAGDVLTSAEIDALLARRHLIDRASNCPHGRPTTLSLSLKDLEKQFKRTGF